MPKVSVIIPTYNRAKYLCEAIDSVLAQTYKDYEIIVVDDGSTDDTKKVLAKYGSSIRYYCQENSGIAVARNVGISLSEGEYIAFLDDDDIWLSDKLKVQMKYLEKNSDIDLVTSRAEIIDSEGHLTGGFKPSKFYATDFEGLLNSNFIVVPSVVFKKKILSKVGYFDEKLRCCEDYELWLRIALKGKIYFMDQVLVKYRMTPNSLSKDLIKLYTSGIYIFKKLDRICNSRQKQLIREMMSGVRYRLAKEYFKKKHIGKFLVNYTLSKFIK